MNLAVTVRSGLLLGLLAVVPTLRADEQKVDLKDVPKEVMASVMKKFPKGEVKEASKEVEDKKTTFEISLKNEGKNHDVSLKPDGTILEIETEIAKADLPKAVSAAIAAKYPGAVIAKAEEIVAFEDGKEEKSYEVSLETADKKTIEVEYTPEGKVIEEDDEDK